MQMIPWWSLLPRPVDPQQQQYNALRALALRSQIQQQQQQNQARNALAQAIGGGATGNALLGPLAQVDPSAAIRLSMDERQRNAILGATGGIAGVGGIAGSSGAPGSGMAASDPMATYRSLIAGGVDPGKAASIAGAPLVFSEKQTEAQDKALKVNRERKIDAIQSIAVPSVDKYNDVLAATGSKDQAQRQAQEVYTDEYNKFKSSGRGGDMQLSPSFDYDRASRNIRTFDLDKAQRAREKEQREQQKQAANIFKPDFKGTVINSDGTKTENVPLAYGGPDGYIDTTTNKPVQVDPSSIVHMPRTGSAGTQKPMPAPLDAEIVGANGKPETRPVYRQSDGKVIDAITNEPIPPDQIKMIRPASAGRPRSAATAFITKYMEEHPDATAEDVAGAAAGFSAQQGGTRAFLGGGRQGDAVRFIGNVVGDHLPTLDKLGEALGNNDVRALNALKNTLKTQFGYAGPVNFDAAKAIISGEITKAVVGGVASMQDRQVLMDDLNRSNSPEQLKGVISTFRMLLAGQLRGLYRQAQVAKVPDDKFRAMLPKSAQEMLDEQGPSSEASQPAPPSAPTAPSAPAASSAAPSAPAAQPQGGTGQQGAVAGPPENIVSQMHDGDSVNSPDKQHRWVKQNGKLVQVY